MVSWNWGYFLKALILNGCAVFLLIFQAYSQDPYGKQLFQINCSACHTLGQGKLIGPDLTGIEDRKDREWITRFIRSSQTMISNGDPEAMAIYEAYNKLVMPDQPAFNEDQINAILAYVGNPVSAGRPGTEIATDPVRDKDPVGPEGHTTGTGLDDIGKGRDIFNGSILLSGGGPACVSCHNVTEEKEIAGGQFAPDLTNVYSKIDESAIMELATAPRYPSMQKAYKNKPITMEEASLLASFLKYAGTESDYQRERDQKAAEFL
ncbi:MAG: cytochrome c, partial [Cyclobacteriaceae bacterium]|nr:cytochrome c [Cyclobacteriaceae bacterium]